MKKPMVYLVAVTACIGIVFIYAIIGALLGWKHGGGVLPMMILVVAITAAWKGIIGLSKEKNTINSIENIESENNKDT